MGGGVGGEVVRVMILSLRPGTRTFDRSGESGRFVLTADATATLPPQWVAA